jgi:hypothetical protein
MTPPARSTADHELSSTPGDAVADARRSGARRDSLSAILLTFGVIALALAVPWPGGAGTASRSVSAAQATRNGYLPHLVSGGDSMPTMATNTPWPGWPTPPPWPTRPRRPREAAVATPGRPAPAARPTPATRLQGMVSFGESIIELQNLTVDEQSVDINLHSLNFFDDTAMSRRIAAVGAISVPLKANPTVTYSDYAARIRSDNALGVLARTAWDGGAMAVYEAPEPATSSILPLFALDVFSHTTIMELTNTNPDQGDGVQLDVYDTDGSILSEWTYSLEPGESGAIDPYERAEFYSLPGNVGDGFIGSVRFSSSQHTAIAAYGDDSIGRGIAGYVARSVASADTKQYLPMVRANADGNSLIAVANTTGRAIDVTITYLGARGSPSGAGQTFRQTFTVGPRFTGFVDLDLARPRGNVDMSPLPRGTGPDRGFYGSAIIEATLPVLAMALEQDITPIQATSIYTVVSSAAYNAFSPGDLARTWVVPRVYGGTSTRTTEVVVMNPESDAATFQVEWGTLQNDLFGTSGPITLLPGQTTIVKITPGENGNFQALVRADEPVAVVAYDLGPDLDTTAYWPARLPDDAVADVPTLDAPDTPTPTATVLGPTATRSATVTPPANTATPTGPVPGSPTATRVASPTPTLGEGVYLPVAYRRWRLSE